MWIDHPERNPASSEEGGQPDYLRGIERPDEHRASETHLDLGHAAEDERTEDALAELGLGDEQRPQPLGWDNDSLHLPDRLGVDHAHTGLSGELSDLGQDLARDHLRHVLQGGADQLGELGNRYGLAHRIAAGDRHPAGEDHVHPRAGFSRLIQDFPGTEPANLAEVPDPVDLGRGKDRKHLLEPRRQRGGG